MTVTAYIVNAFTENGQGGNPAAVVLDHPHLNPEQRQKVAKVAGVSETVFLDTNQGHAALYTAEFYTPTHNIQNCGHATIAAFSLVHEFTSRSFGHFDMASPDKGRPVQNIYTDNDRLFLELPTLRCGGARDLPSPEKEAAVIEALGLKPEHIDNAADIHIRSLGNSFVLVPVKSAEILRKVRPDAEKLKTLSADFNVVGFYPFTRETCITGRDASARMFAPAYGISEESATGMAAASLAEYLYKERGLKQSRIMIEQGRHMKKSSPSLLEARMKTSWFGNLGAVQIGGKTRSRGILEIQI